MSTGGDNWSCMLLPRLLAGSVSTLRLLLEKCSDGAVLVGVGNKDTSLEYYLGQNWNSVSCYFKNWDGDSSMKVVFGSTSGGYGKFALEGDIIECTFD